jgi:hypothetical protein
MRHEALRCDIEACSQVAAWCHRDIDGFGCSAREGLYKKHYEDFISLWSPPLVLSCLSSSSMYPL